MARKQAKRRKQKKTRTFEMPKIRVGRIVAPFVAAGIVFATYQLTLMMLDRTISSIEISGPFQRVTALQIEEAINDELGAGFFTANLELIRSRIVTLPWIDDANVARIASPAALLERRGYSCPRARSADSARTRVSR